MRITKIILFISLSLSAFSQCALVYNPFENQWNCGGASGTVGGASNLATVGAIPYVSSSGVLNQDATALFWDATNDRLGIGTNSPALPLDIVGSAPKLQLNRTSVSARLILENSGSAWYINSADNNALAFQTSNIERARFAATTGNLLIGGTTDGNYRLDIQKSGSTGTLRVYDQTGSTLTEVRAGAGQSGPLSTWTSNAGTINARIDQTGAHFGPYFIDISATPKFALNSNAGTGLQLGSAYLVQFSSTTAYSGTADLGLARNAAGILEINNGTAGTYRDLLLRYLQNTGVTVATLPAAAAGNAGSMAYVTDASATTIGSTVAGGGANKVMVWSNGTAWKIYAN